MSKKRAEEVRPLLHAFQFCRSQADQKVLAGHLDNKGMSKLCDTIRLITRHGNKLHISPARKMQLKRLMSRDKDLWLRLSDKKGKLKAKQELLGRQKGGALGMILATAVPIVTEIISSIAKAF